jgi:hypothetical protein
MLQPHILPRLVDDFSGGSDLLETPFRIIFEIRYTFP